MIFQNHGIGYAKGGTFLIKEFNQETVLQKTPIRRTGRT